MLLLTHRRRWHKPRNIAYDNNKTRTPSAVSSRLSPPPPSTSTQPRSSRPRLTHLANTNTKHARLLRLPPRRMGFQRTNNTRRLSHVRALPHPPATTAAHPHRITVCAAATRGRKGAEEARLLPPAQPPAPPLGMRGRPAPAPQVPRPGIARLLARARASCPRSFSYLSGVRQQEARCCYIFCKHSVPSPTAQAPHSRYARRSPRRV